MTRADTRHSAPAGELGASRSFGAHRPHLLSVLVLAFTTSLSACTLARPERVVAPDMVGVIESVDVSDPTRIVIGLSSKRVAEIDLGQAIEVFGQGPGVGRLLMLGGDAGRQWYASLAILETAEVSGCYFLTGWAAFDEEDSIVFVFGDWQEVGVRIPKADGFAVPPGAVDSETGRYAQGEVGHDSGSFCVNDGGHVFAVP